MVSDSIPSASIPMASSNTKDFAKKKRANRSAKLKQCKLDARREQWLSQVKNKGRCKEELDSGARKHGGPSVDTENERDLMMEKMEINPRGGDESYGDGSLMHHYIDSGSSPSDSPTSHASSLLGSNHSGTNFTASSRSCCSSSSSGCDPEIMSDDGCLDDWEAVADALAETDKKPEHTPNPALDSLPFDNNGNSTSHLEITNQVIEISNANPERGRMSGQRGSVNCQAWRVDDALRPQCLPTLSKQYSFPLNSERRIGLGASVWRCKNVLPVPTSCPICFEELDCTDSSFLPCLCGFRLCLFCHKRILEEDGRCPGCRKQYSHDKVEGEAILDGCGWDTVLHPRSNEPYHGDEFPFDGANGQVAHAFGPPDGRVHFDAAQNWSISKRDNDELDIETFGLHELGDDLGLGHSEVQQAIMSPIILCGE